MIIDETLAVGQILNGFNMKHTITEFFSHFKHFLKFLLKKFIKLISKLD